jgi:hypothetical protein
VREGIPFQFPHPVNLPLRLSQVVLGEGFTACDHVFMILRRFWYGVVLPSFMFESLEVVAFSHRCWSGSCRFACFVHAVR